MMCKFKVADGATKSILWRFRYQTLLTMARFPFRRKFFPRALGCSPERTAGQTACPEEFLARARKVCGEAKGAGLA